MHNLYFIFDGINLPSFCGVTLPDSPSRAYGVFTPLRQLHDVLQNEIASMPRLVVESAKSVRRVARELRNA